MPDTNINYPGVPTATDMEETLLPEPSEMFGYREAFRVDEQANNRDGDSVEYPAVGDDFEGDFVEIEKGDPHPNATIDYEGARADWDEFGFKFAIHQNDVQDSKVNIQMANQEAATKTQMRSLDAKAGDVLDANVGTEVGTDSNPINYSSLVDAQTELTSKGFDVPDHLFIFSAQAWGSMAKTEEFTSSTETFAEEFRAEGILHGEILGTPVIRVSTGPLAVGAGDSGAAYLVDTSAFGWESPRRPFGFTSWEDEDERQTWYALDGRIDWVSIESAALAKIVGGTK